MAVVAKVVYDVKPQELSAATPDAPERLVCVALLAEIDLAQGL
ncbi:MAG TPA: hypothetical protein VLK82_25015 [Candidatus Tectomicrobia bacterium]|nr:hypothetical protein [Candidatus Tectomicrobia bacterium]